MRFPSKFPRDQRDRQKSVEQSRKTVSTKLRVVQSRSIKGRPYSPSRLIYLRKILLGQRTSVYHRHEPHLVCCNSPLPSPVSRVSSLFFFFYFSCIFHSQLHAPYKKEKHDSSSIIRVSRSAIKSALLIYARSTNSPVFP